LDINLHDTYFVVAHFHLVMGAASIFGMLAGVYHWFPRMFGRVMNARLGYLHFWLTLASAYMVFFPMHFIGMDGVPRRYYSFTEFEYMKPWLDLNKFISISAILGSVAQFVFLYNFFNSIFRGEKSGQNPWKANTLEWTAPMDVRLHGNWPGDIPHVYRWPYDYSVPGAVDDFIPQNVSDDELPEAARSVNREQTLAAEAANQEKKEETSTLAFSSLFSKLGFRKG